ncbi:hypothetical protein ODZ60_24185 [Escherichia coli]|uniref:hypothetical protein n=1 Tax=Escherichia coli TaxID=562 RepID=UPI00093C3C33|nr:hypothetical protein [Escherichia coli]EFO3514207.1 hypothetical protein [Escherichia coli]EFO3538965.1 hypothetical protein [Escherichia coli]EFO3555626.1 hypothetical protein [Escherichia coli]EFO3559426.1 hypothetical protein [Escherichia coli]
MTVFLMAVFYGLLKTGSLIALLVGAYKGWTLFWKNYDRLCCGQLKLATALEFFQYRFSDSFGGNPPLYSCGLSAL